MKFIKLEKTVELGHKLVWLDRKTKTVLSGTVKARTLNIYDDAFNDDETLCLEGSTTFDIELCETGVTHSFIAHDIYPRLIKHTYDQ